MTVGGTTARMCQAVHLALFASDRDPREGHTIISHNSQIRLREIQSQSLAHGQQMRSEMVGADIREAWGCQGEWQGADGQRCLPRGVARSKAPHGDCHRTTQCVGATGVGEGVQTALVG